jgi:macrolide-specific efflux system membrane fusion protein
MNKKIKYTIVFLLLAVSIGFSVHFYLSQSTDGKAIFTTDVVRKGTIENVVLTSGVLYPYKLVDVGSQAGGQIDKLAVKLGDVVKQGDLIAQIDSLTQQNALKEAQASLDSINAQYRAKQAQIRQAESEFKRQQQMHKDGSSSQSDYENAEASLLVYKAGLEQIKAQKEQALITVDNAKLDLGYTTIVAPIDGTVIYVSVAEGQTLSDNQDIPTVIELAQLNTMTIKAEVSEADVIHVAPGQQVYFTILGDLNTKYKGVLRAIEPGPTLMTGDDSELVIGDSDAIYYNALFDVENPDNLLRFGMTAQVSIILDSAENALLVPSQVLIDNPRQVGHYQVSVKNGEGMEYRDVEVGINNNIYAQILSGLEEGDEIIIGESTGVKSSSARMPGNGRQQSMGF